MHEEAIERRLKRAYEWLAEYCKYRLQPHTFGSMGKRFEERKQEVFDKGHDAIFEEIKTMVKLIEFIDMHEENIRSDGGPSEAAFMEGYVGILEIIHKLGIWDDEK